MWNATCTSCQSRCPVGDHAGGFSCPHCGAKHDPSGIETGIRNKFRNETGIRVHPDIAPDYPPDVTEKRRPPARWNVVSVVMPFVGLPGGVLFGLLVFEWGAGIDLWGSHPLNVVTPMFLGWLAFCAFGVIAAGIATCRDERLWGVTVFGLILNALPLVYVALNLRLS